MLGNGQPLQGASAMIITEMSGLVAKKTNGRGQEKWLRSCLWLGQIGGAKVQDSKSFAPALALAKSNWLRMPLYQGKISPKKF